MPLIDIKDGCIILHLTPAQCASLAKACEFAGQHTLSAELDLWRTFAALFYAGAVAGFAQWQMCPVDASAVDRQLELSGLRETEGEPITPEPISTIGKHQKDQP
jgi:hypothetical protein